MWVYIWNDDYLDYSAMRGPCPEGFHVPTVSEAQTLVSMKNVLSFDYATYLHSPSCWWVYPDWDRYANEGWWWLCETSNLWSSWRIIYQGWAITEYWASHWFSIRPFKDKAVVPDNSRTREFDWSSVASWAWVFHNTSLWLISISADWINWITIADKNLWATTVWNSWNSMSQSNVWKYYQRWNNYGFNRGSQSARAGTVNTTWYWPWNYYSSSTRYIGVWDTSSEHWYDPINRDLRGGVTGVNHMSELKNAYIGKVIECDFTQSDCWFTFAQKFDYCTYGRNSNWLYCTATGWYYNQAAAWKVPSNIYNQQLKKATFELSWTWTNNGWWFAVGIDTKTIRHFNSLRIMRWTQNSTWTSESSPANTKWTFTIDFVNKVASSSLSSSTLSITDNAISAFNTDWSAGNVNIVSITWPTHNSTSYLSKVIFEY